MITRKIFTATLHVCQIIVVDNKPKLKEHPDLVMHSTMEINDDMIKKFLNKHPGLTLISSDLSSDYYGISVDDFVTNGTVVKRPPSQTK